MDPLNPMFANSNMEVLHDPFAPEDIIISGDSAGIYY
jgi:hypothetical protein